MHQLVFKTQNIWKLFFLFLGKNLFVAQFLAGGRDVDLEVGRRILPKIKTNNRLISR